MGERAPGQVGYIFGTGVCGHTISKNRERDAVATEQATCYLAFGGVAVEAGLGGPVASPTEKR